MYACAFPCRWLYDWILERMSGQMKKTWTVDAGMYVSLVCIFVRMHACYPYECMFFHMYECIFKKLIVDSSLWLMCNKEDYDCIFKILYNMYIYKASNGQHHAN